MQLNALVPGRVRHLSRYREIAAILARHGLGWVVAQLGLGDLVPFQRGWFGHPPRETPYTQAEHFRMAFEDLGVTFIKFGEILSTRADLLPAAYVAEFSKLQDATPPVSYDTRTTTTAGQRATGKYFQFIRRCVVLQRSPLVRPRSSFRTTNFGS